MTRPSRIEHVGGWYHVTARGYERRAIYRADGDGAHWSERAGEMVEQLTLMFTDHLLN